MLGQAALDSFLCKVLPVEMCQNTNEEVRTEAPGSLHPRFFLPPYLCSELTVFLPLSQLV